MQPARKRVVAAVELAARVELGENYFHATHLHLSVDVGGHSPAVVAHGSRAVLVQNYGYFVRVAVSRLVNGVVHYLPKNVVKPLYAR